MNYMSSVELCVEHLRLRLIIEDERCYLQVAEVGEEADHWAETDPYNLLSVLHGLRYHVSAGNSIFTFHREDDEVVVEYHAGNHQPCTCRVSARLYEDMIGTAVKRVRRRYMA